MHLHYLDATSGLELLVQQASCPTNVSTGAKCKSGPRVAFCLAGKACKNTQAQFREQMEARNSSKRSSA